VISANFSKFFSRIAYNFASKNMLLPKVISNWESVENNFQFTIFISSIRSRTTCLIRCSKSLLVSTLLFIPSVLPTDLLLLETTATRQCNSGQCSASAIGLAMQGWESWNHRTNPPNKERQAEPDPLLARADNSDLWDSSSNSWASV